MKKTMSKDDALEDRMEALREGKDWAPRFVFFISYLVLFFFLSIFIRLFVLIFILVVLGEGKGRNA